jgi:hypothetical protein
MLIAYLNVKTSGGKKMEEKEPKERATITIDPKIATEIKVCAAIENRSFSNMVEKILTEYIKANPQVV